MNNILLNISGHPLSEKAIYELKKEFTEIEDIQISNIDFSSSIELQIKNIFSDCKSKIDGSIPLTIIPPWQSTFAILIFSYLHGLIGYPPNICYLEANTDNIFSPKTVFKFNLNKIKNSGRSFRQEVWSKHLV